VFDAAAFPTATFVGDRFGFDGEKLTEVAGTLTIKGRTQPVTLKALRFNCYLSPLFRREVCGGDFEARVLRSAWGLDHGLPALAPDEVGLRVSVEAIRQ
jgi:polyisoprenoid-binding protein YceI